MPELPEVEAWRRQLDPHVKRSPIEQAGPAHIATLKTFDPPLAALEGEGFAGVARRAKRLLFPTDDGELVADGAPDERRPAPLPRAGRRRARRRRCSGCASPTAASSCSPRRARRSAPASGCCGPTRSRPSSRISAPRPTQLDAEDARARSSPPTRAGCTRCCATSALIAGIGRAWANEILHAARLSPVRALDPAVGRGDRAARGGDPRRARARPRAAARRGVERRQTYRVHDRLGEPCRALRHAARARRLRGAHDLLLPRVPDRRPRAQGPADVEAPAMRIEQVARGDRGAARGDPPAPAAAHRGAHAADARAARRDRRRRRRVLVARDDDDGAIVGTLTLVIYRVSVGAEGPDRGRDRRRVRPRAGRRRGAHPRGRWRARTRPAC